MRDIEMSRIKSNRVKGFTLLELMVVVAIIGIISAIAYPSYQDSVRKANRADAKASLLDVAQQLERCFSANGQYTTTAGPPVKNCPITGGGALLAPATQSLKQKYTLSLTALAATSYTLQAVPLVADPQCTAFVLTDAGVRTATGTLGNACW